MAYGCCQPSCQASAEQAEHAARHRAERGDLVIVALLLALVGFGFADSRVDFGHEVAACEGASAASLGERRVDKLDEAEPREGAHTAAFLAVFGEGPRARAVLPVDHAGEEGEVALGDGGAGV